MTKAKTTLKELPVDGDGNILWTCSYYTSGAKIPNFEFDDVLEYIGRYSTQYSKHTEWRRRSDGTTVRMNMTELDEVLPLMDRGTIEGKFTFTRRGSHISVRRIGFATPAVPLAMTASPTPSYVGSGTLTMGGKTYVAPKIEITVNKEENGTAEA